MSGGFYQGRVIIREFDSSNKIVHTFEYEAKSIAGIRSVVSRRRMLIDSTVVVLDATTNKTILYRGGDLPWENRIEL